MTTIIQFCIGLIFSIYGIFFLLKNRKTKENFIKYIVCLLVGIFLIGYSVHQFFN